MEALYDVVIVGGGPAGLTAAIYLARAKYRVLVLEKERFGGQIAITDEVVNYPGIRSVSGAALTDTMKVQAEVFGADLKNEEAIGYQLEGDIKIVTTPTASYRCFGVLIATGAHPRNVGFRGEDEWKGRGVAYCATCDGEFFTGKDIFVVGGGYAAAEESVFLTKFARHVTILLRKSDFSCAASVADKAKNHEKITVLPNTVLREVSGAGSLNYAKYENTATGEVTEYRAKPGEDFGVFVFAGYAPATEQLPDCVERNEQGYLVTDHSGKTSVEGVYGAGDVCIKPLRQVVTATADGALAATELEKYAAKMQEKTGLHPKKPETAAQTAEEPMPEDMRSQLEMLFEKMEQPLILKLSLDESKASKELEQMMGSLTALTEKLQIAVEKGDGPPCVRVCRGNGEETGLAFHGVPGGHEFTSFVLGLYNVAGPGQPLEEALRQRIRAIDHPVEIKILVTLSCTMCPETVVSAQCIAAENPLVTAQVYDARLFPQLREKYGAMSVPCLVIDEQVFFGKKNVAQILELIQ